jgi:hypothetical protein
MHYRNKRLQPEHLWPLTALVLLGCLSALIPIGQIDFWWHLAIGRDIAALGSVPTTANQSWILPPDTPFIYGSWLAEWLLYQIYQLGGLALIVFVRNLLLLASYAVVGLEAWRRSRSWRWAALAIAGAGLITINNVTVRPQIFAWLLFALTMWIVGSYRAGQTGRRTLLVLPLLMIAWVNLHGSFVIGIGLLGLSAIGATLNTGLQKPQALPPARLRELWLITALTSAAIVVNPRGVLIVEYVRNLLLNPGVQQYVTEWQPPALLQFPGILLPLALVCIALGWVRHPTRIDLTDVGLLIAFAFLGASSMRNLLWFGMIAWPIAAGALVGSRRQQRATRGVPLATYSLAVVLCVPLVIVQPPFKPDLDLPPMFRGMGGSIPDGAFMDGMTPVQAVAWLHNHTLPPGARVFHDMMYGSYLMWALPDVQVHTDGRIELYPLDVWMQYRRIIRGENAIAELHQIGATHALLSRSNNSELIDILAAPDSGWRETYRDDHTMIFAHTGHRP